MSREMDLKTPLIHALLIGCVGVGLYCTSTMLTAPIEEEGSAGGGNPFGKEDSIKHVLSELKQEMRQGFPVNLPRDPSDGLVAKEVFIKMHCLIYRYKKYGHDMIIEANTRERIQLLW